MLDAQEPGEDDGQPGTGAQKVPGKTSWTREGRQLGVGKYGIGRKLDKVILIMNKIPSPLLS